MKVRRSYRPRGSLTADITMVISADAKGSPRQIARDVAKVFRSAVKAQQLAAQKTAPDGSPAFAERNDG